MKQLLLGGDRFWGHSMSSDTTGITRRRLLINETSAAVSKVASRRQRLDGSNPSPSAQPSGAPHKDAPPLTLRRFQRPERRIHERPRSPQKSTDLNARWRTTGERTPTESARFEAFGGARVQDRTRTRRRPDRLPTDRFRHGAHARPSPLSDALRAEAVELVRRSAEAVAGLGERSPSAVPVRWGSVRIATWNVNSVKQRVPRLL